MLAQEHHEDELIILNAYIIPMLIEIMENKDQVTLLHSSRVQKVINLLIPELIKAKIISQEEVPYLWVSAILHDIGKIFVDDEILLSDKRLNTEEFKNIRYHSERGFRLINQLDLPREILLAIKHHHERWDGKQKGKFPGYPDGLKGEAIPLYARIICIADAFDAMISERPYKDSLSITNAMRIIKENSGKQFDPGLVRIFIKTMKKNKKI
ncbi:MAG: HD domain-containing protein [bacterium]|nr:HD domain-containing protein [bacterium]